MVDDLGVVTVFLDGLSGLEVGDKARSVLTREVFKARCVHGLEHFLNLLFPVPVSFGQCIESPDLSLGSLAAYDSLS
jgi:hypothetical protein